MRPLAFLSMDNAAGFVSYDEHTLGPLRALGWEVTNVPWRSPDTDWSRFDAVVIRSPWDYQHHHEEFLTVLAEIDASGTRLLNRLEVVHWNIRKSYLQALQRQGIAIVPTVWCDPLDRSQLHAARKTFASGELVVKPTLGAGAFQTYRFEAHRCHASDDPLIDELLRVFASKPCMIQPFLPSVVHAGETSLIYFGGQFSHAVLKVPKAGDYRVQEEHGSCVTGVTVEPHLKRLASAALAVVPQPTAQPLLYARVDVVTLPDGQPAIIELELIEPSLFFRCDDGSPQRFAEALDRQLREPTSHPQNDLQSAASPPKGS